MSNEKMQENERKEQISAWAKSHENMQIALLKELASVPSPSGQEDQRVSFILNWLRGQKIDGAYVDEAKNVLLPINLDDTNAFRVYTAHTDIVFPDTTPLTVVEKDGKINAPGIGDDTANVVALMLCALYLKEHPIDQPMLFVFNSCEEGLGNLKGSRAICGAFSGRIKSFVSLDLTYRAIVTKAVGSERWRVSADTIGGHSFGAFGNPSAIEKMAKLITALYQQEVPKEPGTKTTFNVGTIEGGTTVNSIAQHCEILYEYRSDEKKFLSRMREQFLSILKEVEEKDVKWSRVLIGERPCQGEVDPNSKEALVRICSDAIYSVTGTEPACSASSTDCNIPLSLGIPATSFGTYLGAGAHTREEYVEIDSLNTGLRIALTLLENMAEADKA